MAGSSPYDDRVRALPAGSTRAHARVRLSEGIRDRFWSIPAVLVTSGVAPGPSSSPAPTWSGLPDGWGFGREVRTATAETLLQVMASSMLTFVGVVFTITLVGLQLASSQLSPRVIRTFVRSGVTKTAFGVFLANFAFALTALAFDNVDGPGRRLAHGHGVGHPAGARRGRLRGVRDLHDAAARGRLGHHRGGQRDAGGDPPRLTARRQLRRRRTPAAHRGAPRRTPGSGGPPWLPGVLGTVLGHRPRPPGPGRGSPTGA